MDEKEVVAAVLSRLALKIGSDRFEVWFGANVRLVACEATLLVEVPNQFHQNWLRRNFRGDLEAACQEALGRTLAVEFRVVATLDSKRSAQREGAADPQRQLDFGADPRQSAEESNTATLVLEAPRKQHEAPPMTMSSGRKYASLDSFVAGPANQLAHAAASMVVERLGSVNPVYFYGATSVGKTHLLEGIFQEARRRNRAVNSVFLTAEQFTSGFLEALRGGGLPSYRQKYRAVELLILDDLQFFVGKRATVIEFLHTLDTLVRQGRQLVVAADRPPAELHLLGPEVVTRLSAGLVVKIEPADEATRARIVRQRALVLGLEINDEACEFLAQHLTEHARQLIGALLQLLAASRIRREPITKAIAEEILADIVGDHAKPVQLRQIENAVCEVFGLDGECLQQKRRVKALNEPRMLAMWLARRYTRAALSDIGQHFGRRSHSTVISAQKSVSKWMTETKDLEIGGTCCRADEIVRRVEAKLRLG
jgi:chromosomal replication initiator protein